MSKETVTCKLCGMKFEIIKDESKQGTEMKTEDVFCPWCGCCVETIQTNCPVETCKVE